MLRKKVLLARIEELEQALSQKDAAILELNGKNQALEAEKTSLSAILGEYRNREQSIMTAMTEAGNNAAKVVDEAKQQAANILQNASASAKQQTDDASAEVERLKAEAAMEAAKLKEDTEAESKRILSEAETGAKALMDDATMIKQKAEEEAAALKSDANAEAIRIISGAEAIAKDIRSSAEREAGETLANAKEKSSRLLSATEITAAEYGETLAAYNAQLEQMAADVTANAAKLAAFTRSRMITDTAIVEETQDIHSIPFEEEIDLPDPGDDPAALMRNIYALQRRTLPDGEEETDEPAPESTESTTDEVSEDTVSEQEEPETLDDNVEEFGEVTAEPASEPQEETEADLQESSFMPDGMTGYESALCEENDAEDAATTETEEDGDEAPLCSLADLTQDSSDAGQMQNDADKVTLDELLDEIINSGELNYGKK